MVSKAEKNSSGTREEQLHKLCRVTKLKNVYIDASVSIKGETNRILVVLQD